MERVTDFYEIKIGTSVTRSDVARCTKKDILLFSVIESIFSFINQESR